MKKIILSLLMVTLSWSQQKMNISFEARYELKFKEYKNEKEKLTNNFILLFNKDESFFKNMNTYVKDSLFACGKLKYTGGPDDLNINMKYYIELPYTIYKKRNFFNFSNSIVDYECRYEEAVDFKWKISKETKLINGVKCFKATTSKWGRNWTAYYSTLHPMPFGPYKFYGLPGLIFEIADENKDYTFTLYRYKNRKKDNFPLYNYPKAKKITKSQYEKIRHETAIKPFAGKVEGDPNLGKRITKRKIEAEQNYNPIELTE